MARHLHSCERWDSTAGVDGRTRVSQLADTDPNRALAFARSIEHPWYRCQALSEVVNHLDDRKQRSVIIKEALNTAIENDEPNRIVSVSAWPLQVLLANGGVTAFIREIERLLRILSGEPNPVRRQDALVVLVGKIPCMPDESLQAILKMFESACSEGWGWKTGYNIR